MIIEYKYIKFYKEFKEPIENYNIISCSIFRLIDNYKNENMYTNGLNLLINKFQTLFPNFYLRIYYDKSVLDYTTQNKIKNTKELYQPLFDKLRRNPKVQMIKYEMPQFIFDEYHHKGLVGTITRLYPLFNTEYNKNINTILIADVDMYQFELDNYLINYNKWIKSGVDFCYRTRNCYDLQDRFQILTKYFNIKFPIMAGTILSKMKFPIEIFDNFFECLLNNNKEGCEYYKTFNEFSYTIYHRKFGMKIEYKYGVDETLTMILKEYLYKNKIRHLISIDTDIAKPFYNMYIAYNRKLISPIQFKNTLQYILRDIFNDKLSLKDNYKIIDDTVFYQKNNKNITQQNILDRSKELINNLKNNKLKKDDYAFDDSMIDCLYNSFLERKYYIINYINKFDKNNVQQINFE